MRKIKWGLIATGHIAKAFAKGIKDSETGSLYAVASRSAEKAEAFAKEYGFEKSYGSYEELLADREVDAVYISTPHPMHTGWAIKAAEAKKHILCEKPMAINQHETMSIIEAASKNDVFLMEAYMYRCNPQTDKLLKLIRKKAVGEIKVIKASFSFHAGFDPNSRIWNNSLGGGGILDVGGYTTSYACLVAGAALGKQLAEPAEIKAVGSLHPETGVDSYACAVLKFGKDIIAQCSTGVGIQQENIVQIFGTEGRINLPHPYAAGRSEAEPAEIQVIKKGTAEPEIIQINSPLTSYAYEADVCGRAIMAGEKQAPYPAMTWEESLSNVKIQDQWRREIGLLYESEKIENMPSVRHAKSG